MSKLIRVDKFDPLRCEGTSQTVGQCPFKRMEGSVFCPRHGGPKELESQATERSKMYYLQKWQKRVAEFTEHDQYKELSNELGIMRMMLEEILNQCNDAQDLLRHSSRITASVDKIQKLVETIDKMDSRRALSPENLTNLAQRWVQIINVYIRDPDVLERLSQDLIGTLEYEQPKQLPEQ